MAFAAFSTISRIASISQRPRDDLQITAEMRDDFVEGLAVSPRDTIMSSAFLPCQRACAGDAAWAEAHPRDLEASPPSSMFLLRHRHC